MNKIQKREYQTPNIISVGFQVEKGFIGTGEKHFESQDDGNEVLEEGSTFNYQHIFGN